MGHTLATLLLSGVAAWPAVVCADPASDFVMVARSAIGAPATLAAVHSLYVYISVSPINAGADMPSVEGTMSRGARFSPIAMWIAPPTRFLVRSGSYALGFDSGRFISRADPNGVELTNRFRHWALSLLLYDPHALGLIVTDLGVTVVGKSRFHVLDATADGFDMRLYFDPDSHRLMMSEDWNEATRFSAPGAPTSRGMAPPPPVPITVWRGRVAERDTYGSYRRVDGIELPFSIVRTTEGGKRGPVTILQDVVKYVINPSDLDRQFKQ